MALREIFNETQSVIDNAVRFQELKQLPEFRDNFKDFRFIPIKTVVFGLGIAALAGGVCFF
ncbi:hypothetical protein CXB77_11420 [Chromatium okenii]|uniref:Uncharacterized protein n=1 Tax=Chromatium okenii TaxID=61644 RepID=A0A2S7XSA1_9GAMM|nr:hypothetical protein CXB77_11420 [Chromatium okenii]